MKNKEIKELIETKEKELQQLKRLAEREKVKSGPKCQYSEHLTETMSFILTPSQKMQLKLILKKEKINLSSFVRSLIFGEVK